LAQLSKLNGLPSQLEAARNLGKLKNILQKLWDCIVSPITNKLIALQVPEGTRVWWCPTSVLHALPLHAAGPYKHGQKNFYDFYISSYTSTLSALIRARSNVKGVPTMPKLLAVGQPGDHLEFGALPGVREELHRICSLGDTVDVLIGCQATKQSVLSQLQDHNWVHFACHANQLDEPFQSYFELYDGECLRLIDLAQAHLPNAEFAFLSACHSAAGDIHGTPDEVINLAAAMQFCGFRSVVGTLWTMNDVDGPDIAEDFYGHVFHGTDKADFRYSARALHLSTQAMRQKKVPLDRWVNFVHIGA